MAPTLYMLHASPPVRAVLMTAEAIGVTLDHKEINTLKKENLTPEFLKINPQHTIPTLVEDDGFTVWDSHAIMAYLVSKYAKDDSLYPKDLKKRAIIDQRLHFDCGVAFISFLSALRLFFRRGKTELDQKHTDAIIESYAFVEAFLDGKQWVAGDSVSIADYSLIATVSSQNVMVALDGAKFPKIAAWVRRCEDLPEYKANKRGLSDLSIMIPSKIAQNKQDSK